MRKSILECSSDQRLHTTLLPSEQEALAFLLPLSPDYPAIEEWYRQKVVPGLRIGTRMILRIERQGTLVGLGIAKREGELKLCTVRVAPTHFGRGIGLRIFDGLLRWLNVDKPHLTVSDRKLPAFERLFEHYGFRQTSVHPHLYVAGITELGYNGILNGTENQCSARSAASN